MRLSLYPPFGGNLPEDDRDMGLREAAECLFATNPLKLQ